MSRLRILDEAAWELDIAAAHLERGGYDQIVLSDYAEQHPRIALGEHGAPQSSALSIRPISAVVHHCR